MLKCLTIPSAQPTRICGQKRAEESEVAAPRPPGPACSAAAHLSLAARAPAQGGHRLLAPRLSGRREVCCLFALKVHPCGTRALVALGSLEGDSRTSRGPAPPPTFQDPSVAADPHMVPACPSSRHTRAPEPTSGSVLTSTERAEFHPRRPPRVNSISGTSKSWRKRSLACSGWFCVAKTKSGDNLFVESLRVAWAFYTWSGTHPNLTAMPGRASPSPCPCSKASCNLFCTIARFRNDSDH